ncbi:hypothetical protein BS377_08885 [Campylobacter upsaliensis]|nr:hypothetical protein [Campylobacter upsaliensis]
MLLPLIIDEYFTNRLNSLIFLEVKVNVFLHFINITKFSSISIAWSINIIDTLLIIYLIFCSILTFNPYAFTTL